MGDKTDFEREVDVNFPWNFAVNLVDATFITFGLNLVSQVTIMPLLVSELTSSKVAIGLIPATYSLGYFLPQLLTANFAEGLRRKKPFVTLLGGLGERCPYLLIGLAVWWLAEPAPVLTLLAFFLLLATTAASNGMATPAWYDMIAKVIPVHRRGLWSGVGQSLGALLGIAGGALSGYILANWSFPHNFGLSFILAFICAAISWLGLALTREPENPTVKPRTSLGQYLRRLPTVLRQDSNYVRFLIGRSVANLGTMAGGFFMVYGKDNVAGAFEQVGTLTAILVGSQAVMTVLWGLIGDRKGHKVVLCGAAFSMALAIAVAWMASSPAWLWMTFALLGVSVSADSVSRMNIILEFCDPEDRPTYIGMTNTLLAPARALAPIIGGWLATWAGYRGMFVVGLLVSILGSALLTLWVREPRWVQRGAAGGAAMT
jgi:MFS family permease